jgi:hypothetical protein
MQLLSADNSIILAEVRKFLDPFHYKLLFLFYKHYSLKEICSKTGLKRDNLLLHFIYLGKKLSLYEIDCSICPDEFDDNYVRGFNDCKKKLYKLKQPLRIQKQRRK